MARDTQTISGLDGVYEALTELGREASKNGGPTRQSLYQGAKIVREAAKTKAPKKTGNLRNAIIMVRDRDPRRTEGASERFIVGVKGGGRKKLIRTRRKDRETGRTEYTEQGNAFYWRFIEFGTQKMPGTPFLRPAFEENKQAALDAIVQTMLKRLEALAKKVARR